MWKYFKEFMLLLSMLGVFKMIAGITAIICLLAGTWYGFWWVIDAIKYLAGKI